MGVRTSPGPSWRTGNGRARHGLVILTTDTQRPTSAPNYRSGLFKLRRYATVAVSLNRGIGRGRG